MAIEPFAFTSPEEARLHRLLTLVGEGPADNFRDACRLMADSCGLQSVSHLVGHLLREVESALRDFTLALADAQEGHAATASRPGRGRLGTFLQSFLDLFRRRGQNARRGDDLRIQIERCVRVLKVPGGDAIAADWTKLELHRAAHRRGRDAPREVDEATERTWRDFLRIAGAVLDRVSELYGHYLTQADALLALPHPTAADADRLRNEFPRNMAFRNYFYGKLENPSWLPMLRKRDLLKAPPRPVISQDGTMLTRTHWPEAEYVARMAADRRNAVHVCAVLSEAEHGNDALALYDLAASLVRLPVEAAAPLHERACAWSAYAGGWSPLVGRLMEYAARLLKGGHIDAGLKVVRSALTLRANPRERATERRIHEPQGNTSAWEFAHLLETHGPGMESAAGVRWLELVATLLEDAVRLSLPSPDAAGEEGLWDQLLLDSARRDDEDDRNPRGARDGLLRELRRTSGALLDGDPTLLPEIVKALEARPHPLFRLVLLELLATPSVASSAVARAYALRRELLQERDLSPEYRTLLWAAAPHMSRDEIATLTGLVDEGPDWAKKRVAERERADGVTPEALFEERTERWQRDVLGGMRAALDEATLAKLVALEAKHGSGRPAYPAFGLELTRPGRKSPVEVEEAGGWEPERLLEFVRTWVPEARDPWGGGESPHDLGDVISKVVAPRAPEYSARARDWIGVQKTYVRGILDGLREAAKGRAAITWDAVLALARWAVEQPLHERQASSLSDFFEDPDWGWARSAVLRLLDEGLVADTNGMPRELRGEVWTIIDACLHDPDPEVGADPPRDDGMDAATMSINRRRACALHSAIRYSVWVLRPRDEAPSTDAISSALPELLTALDRHLDPAQERARAVRAVYGWRLGLLWHLDREWATSAIPRVFPRASEDAALRAAAWETWLIWGGQPPLEFATLLHDEYADAIGKLGDGELRTRREDPRHGLVHHLLQFYARGAVEIDSADGLIQALFASAPDELRAEAIRFLGDSLSADDDCPPATVDRLNALWEWRLDSARSAPMSSRRELAAFGSWLRAKCVPADWRMQQAVAVVRAVGHLEPSWHVVETFVELVAEAPMEVLECLERMVEAGEGTWEMAGWEEKGSEILRIALMHERADVRNRARGVTNRLLALGYSSLRPLLGGSPPPPERPE